MKEYSKPIKKVKTEKPICQYCLDNTQDKTNYFWVDQGYCYELACLGCIEKHGLLASRPYFESKKKVKTEKSKKETTPRKKKEKN